MMPGKCWGNATDARMPTNNFVQIRASVAKKHSLKKPVKHFLKNP